MGLVGKADARRTARSRHARQLLGIVTTSVTKTCHARDIHEVADACKQCCARILSEVCVVVCVCVCAVVRVCVRLCSCRGHPPASRTCPAPHAAARTPQFPVHMDTCQVKCDTHVEDEGQVGGKSCQARTHAHMHTHTHTRTHNVPSRPPTLPLPPPLNLSVANRPLWGDRQ